MFSKTVVPNTFQIVNSSAMIFTKFGSSTNIGQIKVLVMKYFFGIIENSGLVIVLYFGCQESPLKQTKQI